MKKVVEVITIILIIILLVISIYVNNRPLSEDEKVYGCIDPLATNYNPSANTMQDSSCIVFRRFFNKNHNLRTISMHLDIKKYSDVEYSFIYNVLDTITSIKNYSKKKKTTRKFKKYSFIEVAVVKIDTIKYKSGENVITQVYDSDWEGFNIPIGDNIQVIEKVKDFDSRSYNIDASLKRTYSYSGGYLINPRSYFKYRIDKREYSSQWRFSHDNSTPAVKEGTFIQLDNIISFMFEDFPDQISIYESDDNETEIRYNIKRFK